MSMVAIKEDNSFEEHFREFVGGRLETDDSALNDPKHKAVTDKSIECEDKIRQLLGSENQDIFFEDDRLIGQRMAISERYAYKRGLADGIKLCIEIGLISR